MPLDDEEKRILKEKYKKHRQSIWFGKSDKKRKKKKDSIESFVSEDDEVGKENSVARKTTPEPDAKTIAPQSRSDRRYRSHYEQSGDEARTDVILPTIKSRSTRDSAAFEPKRASSHSHDDTEITPKQKSPTAESVASEPDIVQLSVRPGTQSRTENGKRKTENGERRTENGERRTENGKRNIRLPSSDFRLPIQELKDKVKDQRWSIWTGTSSRKQRKPRARRRKSKKGEREFWQSTQENESSDDKKGLTWGIVFMVIFGIVGAIVLGIFLGYYYVQMAG